MKSQDILILLKLVLWRHREWSQRELAESLSMSLSEVNHGLKRLEAAKLYNPLRKGVLRQTALDFILHGLSCVFPGVLGPLKRGMPTAHAVLANEVSFHPDDVYVWPHAAGSARGQSIKPLFASVPAAAEKDPKLYELLALIDVLRVGQAREKKIATKKLSSMMFEDDKVS